MRDFETPKKYIETNLYPYGGTDPQNYGKFSPRIKELLIRNKVYGLNSSKQEIN